MQCKFEVLSVPWEKKTELLTHECVGLKERKLSCHPHPEVPYRMEKEENTIKETGVFTNVSSLPNSLHISCMYKVPVTPQIIYGDNSILRDLLCYQHGESL